MQRYLKAKRLTKNIFIAEVKYETNNLFIG
jgi:hypothetical protein